MKDMVRVLPATIDGRKCGVAVRYSVAMPWSVLLTTPGGRTLISRRALREGLTQRWGSRHIHIDPAPDTVTIHIVTPGPSGSEVTSVVLLRTPLTDAIRETERLLPYGRERVNWVAGMQYLTERYAT